MRSLVIAALLLSLSGCAGWQALQGRVATQGAQAADEQFETAEWMLCEGTSVGAAVRWARENPGKAPHYIKFCDFGLEALTADQ